VNIKSRRLTCLSLKNQEQQQQQKKEIYICGNDDNNWNI